jgi:hypothetical protein
MPRRLGENTRLWVYMFLVLRDGEQCSYCRVSPATQNEGEELKLEINHIDQDSWNWHPDNLNLACKSCNLAQRNRASCAPNRDSAHKEKEHVEGRPATRIVRTVIDYSHPEAPATMQANYLFEVDFRSWVLKLIREQGFFPREDAIYAGAEKVGCSPQVTRSYLKKLTSSEGPLKERKDMLGGWMLEFKVESRQDGFIGQESHQAASQPHPSRVPSAPSS